MYSRNKLLAIKKQIQFQMIEIERNFSHSDTFKKKLFSQNRIKQGYLSLFPNGQFVFA
jgi:hypothetical protein